ncbi:MAG: VIT1/CCC1 transporter family protein [Chromatiales bacterium]|nr:VIT1/CCC1 transporter family protein [Chromatiales bacterium]
MAGFEIPFIARHLSAGERLGELLFGLIMTLTFTLTAGFVVGDGKDAARDLLIATIGCNIAWGIIDGGLLILGRVFDRGRAARIGRAIRSTTDDQRAVAAVAAEMDEFLESVTTPQSRQNLYRHIVEQVKTSPGQRTGVRGEDWLAALGVFWLVVFASIPAALPFIFIDEPWMALRVSNAILIALFFVIGYQWAGYTTIRPWRAALSLTLFGIAMVIAAIALGG